MSMEMFQELGLTPNEAKIYNALLTYGGSGVSTISIRAQVHRRNAYDAVQRLLKKGLVFELYSKTETVYEAVDPGKLLEIIREKERHLTSALPGLQNLYMKHRSPELAYIFTGIEGVKNYLREVLRSGEDMYILGAEGAWFDPKLTSYTSWFLDEAKKQGIKIHAIYDDDARDIEEAKALFSHPHKFLPAEYDTQATMEIFGDYIVSYTGTAPGKIREDATIFVLHSPELAKSYRVWWKCVWDLLPAEKKTQGKKKK